MRSKYKGSFFFSICSFLIPLFSLLFTVAPSFAAPCKKSYNVIRKGIYEVGKYNIQQGIKLLELNSQECSGDHLHTYNLAIAYGYGRNLEKMISLLKTTLRSKPKFRLAQLNLGWALIHTGRFKEGQTIIRSLEKNEKTSATRLLLAQSFRLQGVGKKFNDLRQEAITLGLQEKTYYKKLLKEIKKDSTSKQEMFSREPDILLDWGRLYEKIGDYEKAEAYYLQSENRNALVRLITMHVSLGKDKKEVWHFLNPLIPMYKDNVPEDVVEDIDSRQYLTYPEGVLTFLYPEALVFVPAGDFKLGRPGIRKSNKNEFWSHKYFVDNFYIGKYEVSNAEYQIFVESTGYPTPFSSFNADYDLWRGGRLKEDIGKQPVVHVSWYDATNYLQWKTELSGYLYKLPTEERWEKAARGYDGRVYPWGNTPPDKKLANFGKHWNDFRQKYTTIQNVDKNPQGQSPFGAYNMAGNVWEWTSSVYKTFFYDDPTLTIEPTKVAKNTLKVFRGGSWINKGKEIRSTFRNRNWSYIRYNGIGFRIVVEKDPPVEKKS